MVSGLKGIPCHSLDFSALDNIFSYLKWIEAEKYCTPSDP
jgi:hypothetical protein